ncbi:hypothetical protein [Pseudonocardia sp. ICBG1293]|uniref:hypothetical protein n=1 Tax=Pseudonocardia sp. ICBG1293 TaxID=2844382 RepID=UPI001CCB4D4E|nr:hypothetical protein [Pseudonocardia sp. ICBG1293]
MSTTTYTQRAITVILAAAIPMSMTTGFTSRALTHVPHSAEQQVQESFAGQDSKNLEEGLRIIESIPDSALVSDAAWDQWKKTHLSAPDRANVWACSSAIAIAIVSNGFAPAKILKLKTAIKAAGGVKKVAQLGVDAFKAARARGESVGAAVAATQAAIVKNGGGVAQGVLLEFFSLNAVVSGCFQ